MGVGVDKLVSISTDSLAGHESSLGRLRQFSKWDVAELDALLEQRNGFYAFESALHVLPGTASGNKMDIARWNEPGLRKGLYEGASRDYLFFAEDAFGEQFGLGPDGVYRFEPETAVATLIAGGIEEWAALLLADYRVMTGWPLAHEWQMANGAIPPGCRLLPAIPFLLGGEYSVANLAAISAIECMQVRADFYKQTRHLPEGARVKIQIVNREGR